MSSADLGEELSCPICLSLYTEPVSLRCGHDFCQSCIVAHLKSQEFLRVYSCPECRQNYPERPQLERNRKLSNIVERFQSTQLKLEESEILCTFCDDPTPATKTCLHCETSLCHKHLERHNQTLDHALTDPTASFTDRKCPKHKELLKYYCQEDKLCICMSCWVVGDHKGHQVMILDEAAEKRKEEARGATKNLKSQRQETEERIRNLESHRTAERRRAADVTERVTEMFSDIRRHLDETEKRVKAEISRQEEQMSQKVTDMNQQLERQKEELSGRIKQMEELCDTKEPLTVLKKEIPSDDIIHKKGDITSDIRDAGGLNEGMISQMVSRELLHFTDSLTDLKVKRQFPEMEKSDITLDIETANNYIIISEDLCSASRTGTPQSRPDGPERFVSRQVLSVQSFSSGRHYWEVDVSEAEEWLIGAAASSIERKIDGNESFIGYNDKSWGLDLRSEIGVWHNNVYKKIDSKCPIKTVGVYLDYEAGRLSFYQLCDPIRHLHTFTATFTEPLHAAFFVFERSTIRIIK